MIQSKTVVLSLNEFKAELVLKSLKYARIRFRKKIDDITRLTMIDMEREIEQKIKQN